MDMTSFYKLTYGLYVVSGSDSGKASGCIVNTLSQVTAEPIQLTVAINKNNYTEQIIEKTGFFTAVALTQDADMDLIGTFGFKSSKTEDKFSSYAAGEDAQGIPYLIDHTAARYSCRVVNKLDLGTHILFLGEVTEAEVLSSGPVLTYEYYQTVKKGGTPKNASSYQEVHKKGWRCTVCGHIHEADELPEDFICPLCKATADKFEKII